MVEPAMGPHRLSPAGPYRAGIAQAEPAAHRVPPPSRSGAGATTVPADGAGGAR